MVGISLAKIWGGGDQIRNVPCDATERSKTGRAFQETLSQVRQRERELATLWYRKRMRQPGATHGKEYFARMTFIQRTVGNCSRF